MHILLKKDILKKIEAKIAFKTGIAGALAWAAGIALSRATNRPDSLVSGLWCTMSAIVVIQAYLGGTYKAAWYRASGVIVGSLMGGLFTSLFGSNPISLGLSIFLSVILCSLFINKDSIRIACLSVSVVMVLWGLHPESSPWVFAFFRTVDSLFGIAIAILVAYALWPSQATDKLRLNIAQILLMIDRMFRIVTDRKFQDQEIEKETFQLVVSINDLLQQNIQVLTESKMELLTQPEKINEWTLLQDYVEQLFEYIISIKQVYKLPKKATDDLLEQATEHLIAETDQALQQLSHAVLLTQVPTNLEALRVSQMKLQEELVRFRETRATRKFSLGEIESFYVFYYSLNAMVDELVKLVKKIESIDVENGDQVG